MTARSASSLAAEADVSREHQAAGLVARAAEAFGAPDIMAANSGLQRDAASADMALANWQMVIDANPTGRFLCVREAVRQFRKQGRRGVSRAAGKVVCTNLVHEAISWVGHVNCAASKGGVATMTRTLAQEHAPEGIRINGVAPGAIATAINRGATGGDAGRKLLEPIPYGRIGEVEDVARRVLARVRRGRLPGRDHAVHRRRHDALPGFPAQWMKRPGTRQRWRARRAGTVRRIPPGPAARWAARAWWR